MNREPNISAARYSACGVLQEYGIDHPSLIDIESIAFDRSIVVRKAEIVGADAWLLRKGNMGLIRVSTGIREIGRERFAVAHELGHWECHSKLSNWHCTSDDIHAYRGSNAELEANAFAAELLMPTNLLQRYLSMDFCIDTVQLVSADFRVSLTASAVKMVGEFSQDIYVVFSRNSNVTWWRRNERRSGFWIQSKQPISIESKAWGCDTDPNNPSPMEVVPSEAWFPSNAEARDYEVWEQSVLLNDYDIVLTLLCVV